MNSDERGSPATQPMFDEESVSAGADGHTDANSPFPEEEEEEGIVLDPKDSERYTWRDMRTKIEREIWRPGDGDGDRGTDYYDRVILPMNIKDRWRLYQSTLGPIKYQHNDPPKYVFLDDRACFEVMQSNIPRASLGKFWPHDFGLSGKLRDRRPHRGRGSVGDPDAEGNDRFEFTPVGIKKIRYYFTGEKDFTPIIYRSAELSAEIAKKLEKKCKGWAVRNTKGDPKQRGHNQFTPKDWLLKNDDPSGSGSKKKKKKKGAAEYKVPEWLLDKPEQRMTAPEPRLPLPGRDAVAASTGTAPDAAAMASSPLFKKRKFDDTGRANEQHSSSPSQMFPFHQQTVGHQAVPSKLFNPFAPIGNGYHQESTCPYTQSRTYAIQLEKDLAIAHDTISGQKGKIAELEQVGTEKDNLIEELRKELQDLSWSITR